MTDWLTMSLIELSWTAKKHSLSSCLTSIIVSEKKSKFREHVAYYIYTTKTITLHISRALTNILTNFNRKYAHYEHWCSSGVYLINQRQPISSNLMINQQTNLSEVVTWPCRRNSKPSFYVVMLAITAWHWTFQRLDP